MHVARAGLSSCFGIRTSFVIRHSDFVIFQMNQPVLLHIVERLESLLAKLPATIQKPILNELTPLKELFLQQRPPRFVLTGSIKKSAPELVNAFFGKAESGRPATVFRWQEFNVDGRGTICVLDARGAGESGTEEVSQELKRQPADVVLFVDEADDARRARKTEIGNLIACLDWSGATTTEIVGISFSAAKATSGRGREKEEAVQGLAERLGEALKRDEKLPEVVVFNPAEKIPDQVRLLMSILTRKLPNEARIEMTRISRDRESQREIAQLLVKSTSAICAAIGTQPIPLADLPILTTLQLVMVSGIMYLSGRERSLRAATEFVGAIGANVGVGMLLREGARALLKFLPGWGNVICGMVAGAGTYAIGRAATAFFLEGVSLKEARRTYLASRRKRPHPDLPVPEGGKSKGKHRK
jgi:uncharacterized protein (DUF697 family)